MAHFMYQLLWAMGYPDILKNITYGCVSVRVFPDLISLELVDWVEKAVAPHSSTLAWKIPWMEEPGGLLSVGSYRVRHDWSNLAAAAIDWVKQMPLPNLTTTTTKQRIVEFSLCLSQTLLFPCLWWFWFLRFQTRTEIYIIDSTVSGLWTMNIYCLGSPACRGQILSLYNYMCQYLIIKLFIW